MTREELKKYVEALDPIFKEILEGIARATPESERRWREGAKMQAFMHNISEKYINSDIPRNCARMEEEGLVKINQANFVIPTEKGEQVINFLWGR